MASLRSVLLVDDCEAELELMTHYLEPWRSQVRFETLHHGGEAIDFVTRRGAFASRGPDEPSLIVIDNRMPVVGGIEAVQQIRTAPAMRFVPIVMWSGSVDPDDLRRAYQAGVSSYLQKPSTAAQEQEMLHATLHYWLRLHCAPD